MTICQSCGSEVTGPYCPSCGALVQEERATKPGKGSRQQARNAPAEAVGESVSQPAPAKARQGGALSAGRIWRTTGAAALGLAIFAAGILTGFYLDGRNLLTGKDTAAISAEDANLPPSVLGGKYMDQGADLLSQGKKVSAMATFRRSIAQFNKALAEDPNNLYAKSYLGLTYFYMGDDARAVGTLGEVLAKDPNYLWALFNLAWIDESTDKKDAAIALYQRYVDVAPQEKADVVKYAEQAELIDRQVEAAKAAIAKLKGDAGK